MRKTPGFRSSQGSFGHSACPCRGERDINHSWKFWDDCGFVPFPLPSAVCYVFTGSTVWHPDCKQSTKTEEKLRVRKSLQLRWQVYLQAIRFTVTNSWGWNSGDIFFLWLLFSIADQVERPFSQGRKFPPTLNWLWFLFQMLVLDKVRLASLVRFLGKHSRETSRHRDEKKWFMRS